MSCVAMSGTAVATVAAAGRKAIRGGAKVAGGSKVATQARRRVGVCGGAMEVRAEALGDPPVPIAVYAQGVGMMDMFEGLERQRILFIGDRIDENVCNKVCAQLLTLEAASPNEEIRIFLNCTAGTQYCVTAILDMMHYIKCPVAVTAVGCVAGPPCLLLAGATPGRRFALASARIILSQPLGGLAGTSYEVKIQAKVALFSRFTGIEFDDMGTWLCRDSYMSADMAIELGLIDAVV